MESYKKIEKLLEAGVTKEALWDEMTQWLHEYWLGEFADDFARMNDIELEEETA